MIGAVMLTLATLFGAASAGAGEPARPAAGAPRPVARAIRTTLPISGQTFRRVRRAARRAIERARSEGARAVLILEFEVPADQSEFGRGSEFGAAYELADFLSGEELDAATTVAYLPTSIQGHAVLVALACDEIMMAAEATIGSAGIDEKVVNAPILSAYKEIANRRRTVPVALALRMLDPALKVLRVQTEVGTEYVTEAELEELRKQQTIQPPEVLIAAGEVGQFSGEEARRLGFVSYLATDRRGVAKALELPVEAVEDDLSLAGQWRAVRFDLTGPVDAATVRQAQRLIEEEIRLREVNFVCLFIDSRGGSPVDSIELANFLADLDPTRVRTVAYVPLQARCDAALVALACDRVAMHPRAKLGGTGDYALSQEDIKYAAETVRNPQGPWKSRSRSLIAAMIDPKLEVFRCTRPGEVGYFSQEELDEFDSDGPAAMQWQKGDPVTTAGKPFVTDGAGAVEYRLADHTLSDFAEFKLYYDLEDDPAMLESGWADFLIEALASPGVAALLLMIGGVALYVELQAPGVGVGGFVATVCFLLFFWSHYLGGTAGWLEITLFLAGLACLLLEVFILPGFGIFGLGGGCLVLASLILASQTFVVPRNPYQFGQLRSSLLTITAAGAGVVVVAALLRRWLPRAPILSQVLLEPPVGEEAEAISRRESLVDFEGLVGTRGTTTTQLTPSGKARFGNLLVDVITDGDVVQPDTPVEVVEIHGNRVIVKAVDGR